MDRKTVLKDILHTIFLDRKTKKPDVYLKFDPGKEAKRLADECPVGEQEAIDFLDKAITELERKHA